MALLTAIFAAIVITLAVVAGHKTEAKDWLLTGLPAWLQGIGTIIAAYVAWYAFGTWQRQEAARRKAELAEKVLHAASELALSIQYARFYRLVSPYEPILTTAAAVMGEARFERVQQLRAVADKFSILGMTARHMLGPEVEKGVNALLAVEQQLTRAYVRLRRIASTGAVPDEDRAKRDLAIVGCRWNPDDDEWWPGALEAWNKLITSLRPLYSYSRWENND